MYLNSNLKKICLFNPQKWTHHRWGWTWVADVMKTHLHNPNGIIFFDWLDGIFRDRKPLQEPWMGILHNVIQYPDPNPFNCRILSLDNLVKEKFFIDSIPYCLGLWTLSKHTANFIESHLNFPVEHLLHPGHPTILQFDYSRFLKNPRIVMIGQWMRKHHSLKDLHVNIPKMILPLGNESLYKGLEEYLTKYEENQIYDKILSDSIVFLDFYDVAACNTIIECIMSSTPVLVRKLPATIEYLGDKYPFFYDSLFEASLKGNDFKKILSVHFYLKRINKIKFTEEYFIDSLVNSTAYNGLPASFRNQTV